MFFPNETELNDFQLCKMLNDLTNSTENDELISVVQSFRNFENIEKKRKILLKLKKY